MMCDTSGTKDCRTVRARRPHGAPPVGGVWSCSPGTSRGYKRGPCAQGAGGSLYCTSGGVSLFHDCQPKLSESGAVWWMLWQIIFIVIFSCIIASFLAEYHGKYRSTQIRFQHPNTRSYALKKGSPDPKETLSSGGNRPSLFFCSGVQSSQRTLTSKTNLEETMMQPPVP